MIIPAIALITRVLADFFISSSLLDSIAFPKSMLPKTIKIIGISILIKKNTHHNVVNAPSIAPVQKLLVLNSVSSSSTTVPVLPLLFINLKVDVPAYV